MPDPTPQQTENQRLTEYRTLIEIEGYQRRARRYMSGTIETDEVAARTRYRRLTELVDLFRGDPHLDVERDVEAWIESHPLTMTGAGMKRVIDSTTGQGNGISVGVQVGAPDNGGRYYPLHEGQFEVTQGGTLLLRLPDAVAEEFRQQGRRACQREIRKTLGL